MVMVEEGLDMAYGLREGERSFLKKRLVAIPLLVGTVVLGGAAYILASYSDLQLGSAIKRGQHPSRGSHSPPAGPRCVGSSPFS